MSVSVSVVGALKACNSVLFSHIQNRNVEELIIQIGKSAASDINKEQGRQLCEQDGTTKVVKLSSDK